MAETYVVYSNGSSKDFSLRELSSYLEKEGYPQVWSARVGTGLFGLTTCLAGNRGPKNRAEVLLAVGEYGLNNFIKQGFLPCPACKPEEAGVYPNFWEVIKEETVIRYGDIGLEDLKGLPYDIRGLDLASILPRTKEVPERFYLPPKPLQCRGPKLCFKTRDNRFLSKKIGILRSLFRNSFHRVSFLITHT